MDESNYNNGIKLLPAPSPNSIKAARRQARVERYLEGIRKYGTVGSAMAYAGIRSRQTLVNWRDYDRDFCFREEQAILMARVDIIDIAERELFKMIRAGKFKAVAYLLDRLDERYKPKGELAVGDKAKLERDREVINALINHVKTFAPQITAGDERGDDQPR